MNHSFVHVHATVRCQCMSLKPAFALSIAVMMFFLPSNAGAQALPAPQAPTEELHSPDRLDLLSTMWAQAAEEDSRRQSMIGYTALVVGGAEIAGGIGLLTASKSTLESDVFGGVLVGGGGLHMLVGALALSHVLKSDFQTLHGELKKPVAPGTSRETRARALEQKWADSAKLVGTTRVASGYAFMGLSALVLGTGTYLAFTDEGRRDPGSTAVVTVMGAVGVAVGATMATMRTNVERDYDTYRAATQPTLHPLNFSVAPTQGGAAMGISGRF